MTTGRFCRRWHSADEADRGGKVAADRLLELDVGLRGARNLEIRRHGPWRLNRQRAGPCLAGKRRGAGSRAIERVGGRLRRSASSCSACS